MRVAIRANGNLKLIYKLSMRLGLLAGQQTPSTPAQAQLQTQAQPAAETRDACAAVASAGQTSLDRYPFCKAPRKEAETLERQAEMKLEGFHSCVTETALETESDEPSANREEGEPLANFLQFFDRPASERALDDIRQSLVELSSLLGQSSMQEPARIATGHPQAESPPVLYAALSGKKVAVLGLWEADAERVLRALQRQSSEPWIASTSDWGDLPPGCADCDFLVVGARPEWELTEPIDTGFLARTTKPALVVGPRRILTRLAPASQPGPREYLPSPWSEEDLVWRAALLLTRPAQPRRTAERPPVREKPEILIADDDVTTRTLLASLLSKHGMTCHLAENGVEALEALKARRPDAAVLDVVMPAMDGFQVLAAAKQDPNLHATPMIVLTCRVAEVDKLQAFALGADDYMTKPFSPIELAVRLKRLLRHPA